MHVLIDNDTRIVSPVDGMNWTLEKRITAGDKSKNPGEKTWRRDGYYRTCEHAAKALLGKTTPENDTSIQGMADAYLHAGQRITEACECAEEFNRVIIELRKKIEGIEGQECKISAKQSQ